MKKTGYILFVIFMIIGSTIFAQDVWFDGKIIVDVEFEGLKNVDKNELNGIVSPYIGREYTDELFLELQTLMYDLDYFEFIVPNAKVGENEDTLTIVFQVQEAPTISKINFNGNKGIWNSELFNSIVLKNSDIYSDFKVDRAVKKIIEAYHDKGYTSVAVDYEKESLEEENEVKITFNIDEGVQTLIKEINFSGNHLYATDSKLRSLISTKKKSLFDDGVYRESVIQSDKLQIESLYHNNGYINATVVDVKTRYEDDPDNENIKNMYIDFFIEEGKVYTYGGVSYVGNEVYTDTDFDKFETQSFGKPYNKAKHDNRFIKIQSLYYDNGYIENTFHDEVDIDEENNIISHEIKIVEKGIAHIGSITITGNVKTKDMVIEREILIEEGDVFSRQEVWDAMSNIMSTGIFTNVVPQLNKNEDGDMDLVFEVEESRTINLMGGITVSGDDFEPALSFSLKDSNFMGMNRTFGGTLSLGFEEQSFSLEYNEPRIFNTEFFGGISLSYTHELDYLLEYGGVDAADDDGTDYEGYEYPIIGDDSSVDSYTDYVEWVDDGNSVDEDSGFEVNEHEFALSVSGGHLWYTDLGRFKASSGYTGAVSKFIYDTDYTPYDEDYQTGIDTWSFADRVWIRGVLDNRDTPVGTMEGYGLSQTFSLGGIIDIENDSHYIKSVSNADYYFKLFEKAISEEWDFGMSLRLHAAYTTIFEKPGTTLNDDYRTAEIDGMFVGRGWSSEDEGEALLDMKVELNVPIVQGMLGSSLFLDVANLWTEDEDKTDLFDIEDYKFSLGASIGIINQILPISFFIAVPFTFDSDYNVVWSDEEDYQKFSDDLALTWGISFNLNYLMQ